MNNVHADPERPTTGFWKRLVLAFETMGESDEERLEKRVRRLEAEVARLSEIQKKKESGRATPKADVVLPVSPLKHAS